MRRLFLILILALLLPFSAWGQSCTSATCNAATCNESDVLAAMPSSSTSQTSVTVNIPGGTCSWTSDFTYTIPPVVTKLTVQGATVVTCTGTAGTSGYACSATDNTIVQDADSNNSSLIFITTGTAATFFTLSGLTIESPSGATKFNGEIGIGGNSQNVRFTNNHIQASVGHQNEWVRVQGHAIGVIDHNLADIGTQANLDNVFQAFDPVDDNLGWGDGSWANGPLWGSLSQLYIENNVINGGAANDCTLGARFVMRYNTINNAFIGIQTHGLKSTGGSERSCLSYEAYHNYFTGPGGASTTDASTGSKGGTALLWDNTMAGASYRFFVGATDRNTNNQPETPTPVGWGYCGFSPIFSGTVTVSGTSVTGSGFNPSWPTGSGGVGIILGSGGPGDTYYLASAPASTSLTLTASAPSGSTTMTVGSNWDGNASGGNQGWPCMDGLGRGQDTQALNGQPLPSTLNSVTGTVAWPKQYLFPIYLINNSIGSATYVQMRDNVTVNNQDYYYDQSAQSGSFNGTAGTGSGLLSARPSTCTPGGGGTFLTSPTGSYGPAYLATDACSGNGQIYACSSTNTWTPLYPNSTSGGQCGPAVYPHPLVSGGSSSLTLTVSTAGTGSGTVGGAGSVNCANGTYPSGTTITCTETATSGTFTGWSGGSCSGTGSCSFILVANSTVTATFALTAATPTFSPAAGSYATPQLVTISDTTPGAAIFWTGDGSTPTPSSNPYTGPIIVNGSQVLHNDGNFQNDISGWDAHTSPSETGGVNAPASTVFTTGNSPTISGGGSIEISETTIATSTQTNFLVVNNTLGACDTCTFLNEDFQLYIPTSTYSNASSYEMDQLNSNVTTGYLYMFGLQCNLSTHNWQYANETSSWADAGLNCTTPLTSNTWHHIQVQDHWVLGDTSCTGGVPTEHYDWIVVDGTRTNWNLTICATTIPVGWGSIIANQFQIDIGATSGTAKTATIYLDEGSLAGSNGVGFTTTTLKAIATATGYLNSPVGSAAYTINGAAAAPTFSPVAGSYGPSQNVTASTTTTACNNSTDLYTGTTNPPTTQGNTITVSTSETIYSYVHNCSGWLDSTVSSAAYVINGAAATPTFSPAAGSYSSPQSVTISDSTPSSTIYYTLDGSTPTTSSPVYSTPISIASTTTVKAIATAAGFSNSAVGLATYTITSAGPSLQLSGTVTTQGTITQQ